jgi:hypothetical protein
MQLKVFINDKLYKTVTVPGTTYNPNFIWPEIEADRDSGLLNSFDLEKGLSIRYEKVA